MSVYETYADIRTRILIERKDPQPGDAGKLRAAISAALNDATFSFHDALALLASWRDHPEYYTTKPTPQTHRRLSTS